MHVFLLFVAMAHVANPMAKSIDVVQRLNYGVIFDKIGVLNNAEQMWIHTIHIPFPVNEWPMISPPFCPNGSLPCGNIWKLWTTFETIRQDIEEQVANVTEEIKSLVPEHKMKNGRSHRAILGFVGSLSKSIFGTATVKDMQILTEHINEIVAMNNRLTHAFETHAEGMSSYMSLVNKRLDKAFSAIRLNHDSMTQMAKGLLNTMQDVQDRLISITDILLSYNRAADQIARQLNQFMDEYHTLLYGKLSPKLVPFSLLSKILYKVKSTIKHRHPGFTLLHTEPTY